MESMINLDGANLIFATSFGYYNPFVVDTGQEVSRTSSSATPRRCGTRTSDPTNAGRYFGYLNQAHYVNGVAAGLSTKTNKIGFVAAKPIPSVLRNINSVLLGARKVESERDRAGDLHRRLVACRCARPRPPTRWSTPAATCITCHVDSPKVVIETAEGRGVKTCGHNASQAPLAPKGFITGAEYKWETIYKAYADKLATGETLPNFIVGGYDNDMVQNTPYGAGATPRRSPRPTPPSPT